MKFVNKSSGAISIFLCIIMMANILLASVLIEGTRMKRAESQMQEALENSVSSTLAGYQSTLKNLFGVFAIAENDRESLKNEVENYLNNTLMTELGVSKEALDNDNLKFLKGLFTNNGDFENANFVNLYDYKIENVEVTQIHNLTENKILKQQILEFMKYRAPKIMAEGFLDKITSFKDLGEQSKTMSSKTKLDKELNIICEYQKNLSECIKEVNKFNTADDKDYKVKNYMQSEIKEYRGLICERILLEKKINSKKSKLKHDEITKINKEIKSNNNKANKIKTGILQNAKSYVEHNKDSIEALDNIREYSKTALDKINRILRNDLKDDNSDFAKSIRNEVQITKSRIDNKRLSEIENRTEKNIKALDDFENILRNADQTKILESQITSGDKKKICSFVEKEIKYSEITGDIKKYEGTCNGCKIEYFESEKTEKTKTDDDPRDNAADVVKNEITNKKVSKNSKSKLSDKDLVSKTKKADAKEIAKTTKELDKKDNSYIRDLINRNKIFNPSSDSISDILGIPADSADISSKDNSNSSEKANKIIDGVEFSEDKSEGFSENGLDFVANLGSLIKKSLLNIRDNLYINEYIMGSFKNSLTNKKIKGAVTERDLRDNIKNSRKTFFKTSEVEYVLSGNKDEKFNEYSIKAEILLIRFALNTLYIYMDAQKNSIALEAATVIAGWTGFGVPIVQTLIMLAWAMAESVVDVNNIMNGQKVPLYKTKNTWVLSETSMIKAFMGEAVEKASEVAKNAVDLGIDKATDVSKTMIKRAEELIKSKIKIAVDSAFKPLENIINNAGEKADELFVNTADSIEKTLKKDSSTMNRIEAEIYNCAGKKFGDVKESLKEKLIKMPKEKALEYLYDTKQKICSGIYKKISSFVSKLKKEIDDVSKKSKDKIDEYIEKAFGKTAKAENNSTFKSCILSLDYKDYLRIFLLTKSEDTKLDRIEDLIQLNMRKETGFKKFKLMNYNTCMRIEANVSYKFMFAPVSFVKTSSSSDSISRHLLKSVIYKGYY